MRLRRMPPRTVALVGLAAVCFMLVVWAVFLFAASLSDDVAARVVVEQYGYLGMFTIAFALGFNVFVPVPPDIFAPVFSGAGFSVVSIILTITAGTVIADIVSFAIGRAGETREAIRNSTVYKRFHRIYTTQEVLIIPAAILYFIFAPLPNEIIMLPLGLLGMRFIAILPPLVVGSLIHHAVLIMGTEHVFDYFF